jgi:aspartyl-tRNA synthetase
VKKEIFENGGLLSIQDRIDLAHHFKKMIENNEEKYEMLNSNNVWFVDYLIGILYLCVWWYEIEDKNDKNELAFSWTIDYPLFTEQSSEDFYHGSGKAKFAPSHHMFTAPHPEDVSLLDTDPMKVRGQQQEDNQNREPQSNREIRKGFAHRGYLSSYPHRHSAWRSSST